MRISRLANATKRVPGEDGRNPLAGSDLQAARCRFAEGIARRPLGARDFLRASAAAGALRGRPSLPAGTDAGWRIDVRATLAGIFVSSGTWIA
jgi:hypothetical protein